MGLIGKIKKLQFFKRVGLGVLDVFGLGTIKDNIENNHKLSETGQKIGAGQIDWVRLSTFVLVAAVLLGVIFGKIDMETAKELVSILK